MQPITPKKGARYLTVTGTPIQILEIQDGYVLAQSLVSDNKICLPADYPLFPFKPDAAVGEMRPGPYVPRSARPKGIKEHPAPLAPIIDALLLKGGLSIRGIAREVRRRASASCRGKDVMANVRARLYWLQKRHYRVEVNEWAQYKVFAPQKKEPPEQKNP